MVLCALILLAGAFFSSEETLALGEQESLALGLSHYIMGLIYDWNGQGGQALLQYKEAAAHDPSSFAIHLRLGANYARAGEFAPAIEELKTSSQINFTDMQPHYLLALIYSAQQQFDKTAEEYEIILKHLSMNDPENVEIYGYLGQLYYSQKKFVKAIEQFQQILKLDPKNVEVMFTLGMLHLDNHDRTQAVDYFKQAITADPNHEGSLNSLGYMYAEDGTNLDEAMTLIKKAIQINPSNGAYLDSLGWVYFKKNMYKEALEFLLKANDLNKDPTICDHIGDAYYQLQNISQAEVFWKKSLEILPDQDTVRKKLENLKKVQEVKM